MGNALSSSSHAKQQDAALLEARPRALYVVAEHAEAAKLRVFDLVRAADEAVMARGQRVVELEQREVAGRGPARGTSAWALRRC